MAQRARVATNLTVEEFTVFPTPDGKAELPRTVRAPDVAFVRQERLSPGAVASPTLKVAPDLAAEILSPSETASRLGRRKAMSER